METQIYKLENKSSVLSSRHLLTITFDTTSSEIRKKYMVTG